MLCITMDNTIPICRACLKTSLKYIDFETPLETQSEANDDSGDDDPAPKSFITYWDCFRACTQLEWSAHEEHMPQSLCDECGIELSIAYDFLKKALNADKLLKQAAGKQSKTATNAFNKVDVSSDAVIETADIKEQSATEDKPLLSSEPKLKCNENTETEPLEAQQLDAATSDSAGEQSASGGFMYVCNICNHYFNAPSELSMHLAEQHDELALDELDYGAAGVQEQELKSQLPADVSSLSNVGEQMLDASSCQTVRTVDGKEYYVLELLEEATDDATKNQFYEIEQYADADAVDNNDDGALEIADSLSNDVTIMSDVNAVTHMDTNNENDMRFNCRVCEQSFDTQRLLLQHWRTQHSATTQPAQCKICHQEVGKSLSMRQHLQRAHSGIVQCEKCEYRCKESKLAEHEQRVHAERHDFICNICSKAFSTQGMLKSHLKYHQRKQANLKSDACAICGKQFSTKHYLRQHMDLHRNERELHQCDHCEKIYVTKTALENHMRLHKGETIKCDECGKQFVRQYELNVHMRFHTRDYPFECEICNKKFAIKGHLRTHMWRHQGLKLQCEECGKLFTSTKALQEHSFVHTEMPFPCSYCGRAYPSKQKFKVHLKATHLLELTEEELQKVQKHQIPKPLQRKKLTLVQADSVMKEVEVKDENEEVTSENMEEILVELC